MTYIEDMLKCCSTCDATVWISNSDPGVIYLQGHESDELLDEMVEAMERALPVYMMVRLVSSTEPDPVFPEGAQVTVYRYGQRKAAG